MVGGWLTLSSYGDKIPAHREDSYENIIQKRTVQPVVLGMQFKSQVADARCHYLSADRVSRSGQHFLLITGVI